MKRKSAGENGATTAAAFWVADGGVAVSSETAACGPQYAEERQYLDFYLGVQLVDGGLQTTDKFLSHYAVTADELNCNFERSDAVNKCLWQNAPSDGQLDTVDFHMFRKSDAKIFPVQLRPGPIHPPLGNNMILAGDTTAEEQSAVYYSAPIACQKGVGKLTFIYWVYNDAKIEVLLIKPMSKDGPKDIQVVGRPEINCNYFRPQNEKCAVIIPPMEEPFQIGIRAFDLQDALVGSLVIIDEIRYEAELCKKHPDFGPAFASKTLVARPGTAPIITASDLDCSHINTSCRWGNGEEEHIKWERGNEKIDPEKWAEVIGQEQRPTGPFVFLFADKNSPKPFSIFKSDPIPCMAYGGRLIFKYWLKPKTRIQLCSTTLEFLPLSCAFLNEKEAPGPVAIEIDGPVNEPFMFTFEVVSFDETEGGFAAIDELKFEATLCHETTIAPTTLNPWDFGAEFKTGPLPLRDAAVQLETAKDLGCNFEAPCLWMNSNKTPDNVQWKMGGGQLEPNLIYGLTGSNDVPNDAFAVAQFPGEFATATMTTEDIPCLNGPGEVSFRYWATNNVSVQACASFVNNETDIECTNFNASDFSAGVGMLHLPEAIDSPFRLRILASGSEKGTALLDDIRVIGDICSTVTPPPIADACDVLPCNFENEDFCSYKAAKMNESQAIFSVRNSNFGVKTVPNNQRARTRTMFAWVTLDKNSTMAVLESEDFIVHGPALLRFGYRRGTFGSQLFACRNTFDPESLNSCDLLAGPKLAIDEFRGTAQAQFELSPEDSKLFIVAQHEKHQFGKAAFAIDNIRLTDIEGEDIC
uniref:MAM domain-containing protein n=1 Tax=Plectus sambesii TaxID=2011161 RepID=A0A914WFV5_9BILA